MVGVLGGCSGRRRSPAVLGVDCFSYGADVGEKASLVRDATTGQVGFVANDGSLRVPRELGASLTALLSNQNLVWARLRVPAHRDRPFRRIAIADSGIVIARSGAS